jgi:hypothetical protein
VQKPDLMTMMEVRVFFGGTRLIDTSTLYRGMTPVAIRARSASVVCVGFALSARMRSPR